MDRLAKMTAFAKVAETGSFTKAARALRLSPTIISKHVRELEESLGVRLLNRTTRHVGLTEIGNIYYEQCADLLTQLEALDHIAGELQNTPTGVLRVTTPLAFGMARIAPLLARFSAAYPNITVETILTDRYVDVVEEGYDVAVTMNQLPESSYITRTLSNTGTILCATPEYLARHGTPATPEDLAAHNCLIVISTPLAAPWNFTGPDRAAHHVKVHGNLRTNSAAVALEAALRGQGLTLQPDFLVEQALQDGRMVRLLPDYTTPQITFRMVYPPGRHLTAKLRTFADFLVANLSG